MSCNPVAPAKRWGPRPRFDPNDFANLDYHAQVMGVKYTSNMLRCHDPSKRYNKKYWQIVPESLTASGAQPRSGFYPEDLEAIPCGKFKEYEQGPQEFHKFQKLPEEIRRMVWTWALPGPRVIELREEASPTHRYQKHIHLDHNRNLAGLEHLLTCKEASDVFFEHYHTIDLKMPSPIGYPNFQPRYVHPPRRQYIDSKMDTLIFGNDIEWRIIQSHCRLDLSRFENLGGDLSLEQHIPKCPNLKTFTMVYGGLPLYQDLPMNRRNLSSNSDRETGVFQLVDIDSDPFGGNDFQYMEAYCATAIPWLNRYDKEMLRVRGSSLVATDFMRNTVQAANRQRSRAEASLRRYRKNWPERGKNVKLRVAVLAEKRPLMEGKAWIVPRSRHPVANAAVYHTMGPKGYDDYELHFPSLNLRGRCRRNGALDCAYNGIREMFEEGGNELREQGWVGMHCTSMAMFHKL